MHFHFVSAVDYLTIPGEEVIGFGENLLIVSRNNEASLDRFGTETFLYRVGEIERDKVLNADLLYFDGEYENILIATKRNNQIALMNFIMSLFELTIDSLWFIKDNSCFVAMGFFVFDNTADIASIKNVTSISNALGKFEDCLFSIDEIKKASAINLQLGKFFTIPEDNGDQRANLKLQRNRIERAYDYLRIARSNTQIHQKIAFYVTTLECLFSTSFYKNSIKIPKRSALYIGGNGNDIEMNKNILTKAYSVRSDYFHGGVQDIDNVELGILSQNIDQLLREILVKVIMEDSSLFLQSNDDMNLWFQKLDDEQN